ncbi:MAG: glucose-6-phosphate isomerase [Actinobacteria bacterium]|nr:MAG: glucose-6-phosphate isomerase [Actinomycetota bacterium]
MLEPFVSSIDFSSGKLRDYDNKLDRKLSSMLGMFADKDIFDQMLAKEDSMVYEVFEKEVPEQSGQLAHAVTVIHPGKVGNEYFMTKGHFHVKENNAEIYLGIKGNGGIIMQNKEGQSSYYPIEPGTVAYVAPYWAHRTVNTGNVAFSFLAIYPADAGHDYGSIEQIGFPKLVVEQNSHPELVDNPKFTR